MSAVIRLPMPCEAWGANDAPSSTRGRIKQHHRKVAVRDSVTMVARSEFAHRQNELPLDGSIVHVTIPFKVKRKRDPHNYTSTVVKAVIDGLRAAGVFTDDTAEYLSVEDPDLIVGRDLIVSIRPR